MNTAAWIIFGVAAAAGIAATLLAWLVSQAVAAVPEENRQYKDAPPLGFRLVWWPIQWTSYFIRPLVSKRRHDHRRVPQEQRLVGNGARLSA